MQRNEFPFYGTCIELFNSHWYAQCVHYGKYLAMPDFLKRFMYLNRSTVRAIFATEHSLSLSLCLFSFSLLRTYSRREYLFKRFQTKLWYLLSSFLIHFTPQNSIAEHYVWMRACTYYHFVSRPSFSLHLTLPLFAVRFRRVPILCRASRDDSRMISDRSGDPANADAWFC